VTFGTFAGLADGALGCVLVLAGADGVTGDCCAEAVGADAGWSPSAKRTMAPTRARWLR